MMNENILINNIENTHNIQHPHALLVCVGWLVIRSNHLDQHLFFFNMTNRVLQKENV